MKNDKPHGHGTYTWPNGEKYVGEWLEDEMNGYGTATGKDFKYIGEFIKGEWFGQGTFTNKYIKYVGEFKHDEFNGEGTFTEKDLKYVGGFKNGELSGQGTLTTKDGFKYIGEFKNDKEHGHGTAINPDGSKYVGGWEDGEQCGEGTFTDTDGKVEEGVWEKESEEKESAEKKDGFDFLRHGKKEKLSDKLGKKFIKSDIPDVAKVGVAFTFFEGFFAFKSVEWIVEKYKNRIREKAIEAAKEKLKYQKKKASDLPEDQLEHWVMDAEKKIKSKDKWTLLKIILLPTGVSFLPWL